MVINGTVVGDGDVVLKLGVVVDKGSDFSPAWPDVNKILAQGSRRQFSTRGAYASGGWKPLTASYRARKAISYPGKPINRRTDRLWKSLTDPNASEHIFIPRGDSMSFGSKVGYGVYVQAIRPVVALNEELRMRILKRLQEHIIKHLGYRRVTL